jgi:flagellar L-ring protein precursor FlgH
MGIRMIKCLLLLAGLAWLSGCSTVPSTSIKQPLTALPAAKPAVVSIDGAIFHPQTNVALFEDNRAHRVGDTLTVNLVENNSTARSSATSSSRDASASLSVPAPTILGKNPGAGASTSWSPSSKSATDATNGDTNTNTITGTITVTVVEVLGNGNLVVAGEKQVAVNQDTEYIRLKGVVNPVYLSADNTIDSTQLADVQIESKDAEGLDKAQFGSMIARFFNLLLPF